MFAFILILSFDRYTFYEGCLILKRCRVLLDKYNKQKRPEQLRVENKTCYESIRYFIKYVKLNKQLKLMLRNIIYFKMDHHYKHYSNENLIFGRDIDSKNNCHAKIQKGRLQNCDIYTVVINNDHAKQDI